MIFLLSGKFTQASGWHMDCLQLQLEEAPSGDWNCPYCPPREYSQTLQDQSDFPTSVDPPQNSEFVAPSTPGARESLVASSSRSAPRTVYNKQKGKSRAVATDESEADAEGEIVINGDVEETPVPMKVKRKRGRPPGRWKKEAIAEVGPESESGRRFKGVRLRLTSPLPPPPPPSPPRPTPMIRLKLTARTAKGKEREDEPDDLKKGMFDDLLNAEDRDTLQTIISNSDKMRFDKSRNEAEVSADIVRTSFQLLALNVPSGLRNSQNLCLPISRRQTPPSLAHPVARFVLTSSPSRHHYLLPASLSLLRHKHQISAGLTEVPHNEYGIFALESLIFKRGTTRRFQRSMRTF